MKPRTADAEANSHVSGDTRVWTLDAAGRVLPLRGYPQLLETNRGFRRLHFFTPGYSNDAARAAQHITCKSTVDKALE